MMKSCRNVGEHGMKIPDEVQGWLLLKTANVTREQRQKNCVSKGPDST